MSTHGFSGDEVKADLADGGGVTVGGRSYPVNAAVNDAIGKWPSYYDAGVVGPDAFPDIAFGQGVIHPGEPASTGTWLRYVLQEAWEAQGDSSGYTPDEKEQILAFSYGFLTHAAGDVWAHTLINDFADGVFPPVAEVISRLPAAKIALRHLVSEGYVGLATPGIDSADADEAVETGERCDDANQAPPDTVCNPGTADETKIELSRVCADQGSPPTPGTRCTVEAGGEEMPDISADASPGVRLDAPINFLQNVMIDLSAATPADDCDQDGDGDPGCPGGTFAVPPAQQDLNRGLALGAVFLDNQARLQVQAAKSRFDATHTMCSTTLDPDCHDSTETLTVRTVRGVAQPQVPTTTCTAQFFCVPSAPDAASDIIDGLIADYFDAWVADISELQDHWAEFGLALSRGLFDPQTRRDAANDECGLEGPESITNTARNECEAGVGHLDAIVYALDHFYSEGEPSFINRYLIPAAGLPDAIADIRGLLQRIGDAIEEIFEDLGIRNPISALLADAKKFVREQINDIITDQYGLDIEALEEFSEHPSRWMCGIDEDNPASVTLPEPIGTITPGGIFSPEEHAKLDGLMGLGEDHHEPAEGLPEDCGALGDHAKFDQERFAAVRNTVTTAKLLLLDGSALNKVLGDALVEAGVIKDAAAVTTYRTPQAGIPANVLVDALDPASGTTTPDVPWLQLIDGDHNWRQDGLPRFCDNDGSGGCTSLPADLPAGVIPSPRPLPDEVGGQRNGGNGTFPIWESCLLRPAFRALYHDWENGQAAFPDLGDAVSPDASDPEPPASTLTASGRTFTQGDTTFVGPGARITLSAQDAVFADARLGLRFRIFADGAEPGELTPIANGGEITVPDAEGRYRVQFQAQDPCHPFDAAQAAQAARRAAAHAGSGGGKEAKTGKAAKVGKARAAAVPVTALAPAEPLRDRRVVRDTTAPAVSISSPAPEGVILDGTGTTTIAFDATDASSGVGSATVTLDGAPASNGQQVDLATLSAGEHRIAVTATDNVGNTVTVPRTFQIRKRPGPTASPTPTPTPSGTPSTSPPRAGGGGSGGLAGTGAALLTPLAAALVLVLLGAGLIYLTRRRRRIGRRG